MSHFGLRDPDGLDAVDTASYAKAVLNILEDAAEEQERLHDVRRAVLNILEDHAEDKTLLENTQRAVLNILDDFDDEKTKVERANVDLHHEIAERERSQRWLEAVRETSAAFLGGAETDEVLRLMARRSRELVDADLATVIVPGDADGRMRIAVAEGSYATELQGMPIPEDGLAAEVVRSRRPMIVADASVAARALGRTSPIAGVGPCLLVPLSFRDAPFGTLAVGNLVGGRSFQGEDLGVLQSFAEQASLGLEFSRSQRQLQHLSLVEERERIARDLHDDVIQALFAVGLGLQAAAGIAGEGPVAARLQDAVNVIDRVIGDLRSYIFGLRPRALAEQRLGDVLDQLANEFQRATGVTTVVEFDESLEPALAAVNVHLAQLTREALSNVHRHADAQTCRVSLRRHGDAAVLEIDDDGRGFDVEASRGRGMGLGNIAGRVGSIGGELAIVSQAGEGTTVRISVPL